MTRHRALRERVDRLGRRDGAPRPLTPRQLAVLTTTTPELRQRMSAAIRDRHAPAAPDVLDALRRLGGDFARYAEGREARP